ncbi:hypothetical protein ACHAWF_001492, partial [Thalassiosira exigua]
MRFDSQIVAALASSLAATAASQKVHPREGFVRKLGALDVVPKEDSFMGPVHAKSEKSGGGGERSGGGGEDDPETIPGFEPAMPIEYFQNIDQVTGYDFTFEWVNPGEVKAGATTCGFLTAPLGTLPGANYPNVEVYFCVRFATVQPAPRGNIIGHCGGPGTLSACGINMVELDLDPDTADSYNIIGFDQRGMGRSMPTFIVKECTDVEYGYSGTIDDYTNETLIREAAKKIKARNIGCLHHGDFQLPVPDDPYNRTYNFLQYSGSRQAADDINRMRVLFGDQPISMYGASYGAKLFAAYATAYPLGVNLMVLDAAEDPDHDIVDNFVDALKGRHRRIHHFVSVCSEEVSNTNDGPTPCGISDPSSCIR